jgi:hypothetical protein
MRRNCVEGAKLIATYYLWPWAIIVRSRFISFLLAAHDYQPLTKFPQSGGSRALFRGQVAV